MTEQEAIDKVNQMGVFEKAYVYRDYVINSLYHKYTSEYFKEIGRHNHSLLTYEQFSSPNNIITHCIGEEWEKQGFASSSWISLNPSSMYHYVYHNRGIDK